MVSYIVPIVNGGIMVKKTHSRYKKGKRHGRWVSTIMADIFTENALRVVSMTVFKE